MEKMHRVSLVERLAAVRVLGEVGGGDRVAEDQAGLDVGPGDREHVVDGAGNPPGDVPPPRQAATQFHDLLRRLAVDQVRRLVARRRALREDEDPVAETPVDLLAHLVPEIGRDLVQVLRLLEGQGALHHHAAESLGPPEKEQVDGVVLVALDVREGRRRGVAVHLRGAVEVTGGG